MNNLYLNLKANQCNQRSIGIKWWPVEIYKKKSPKNPPEPYVKLQQEN